MRRLHNRADYKVEFNNSPDGDIEIRYFDTPDCSSYLSWMLSRKVVEELICWWKKLRKNESMHFPVKMQTEICEFIMHTEESIEVREFDKFGRYKTTGWNLPKVGVKELIDWYENKF